MVLYFLNTKIDMNIFAIIENDKVVNTVIAEHDYANEHGWIACPENVGIGFDFINGAFVDNRPAPEVVQIDPPTKEELLAQLEAIQKQILAL